MGTNYYVRTPPCDGACEHCSQPELIHLGKSSAGWKFTHKANPDWPRTEARERWLKLAASGPVEDEYGVWQDLDELLAFIDSKQGGRCHCVDHGPQITGPYWSMFKDDNWHDHDYDFTDREFS